MQEVEIGGVQVKFPFEPYQVQKNYMAKVIECLENGKNGILESPTGLLFFYENKWWICEGSIVFWSLWSP